MKITEEEKEEMLRVSAEVQKLLATITLTYLQLKQKSDDAEKKLAELYLKYGVSRDEYQLADSGEFVKKVGK
jgi:hypothetical protein